MEHLGLGVIAIAFTFFGWMYWVSNPKHPERMAKLRREFGITTKN
jgi:hypothetical protein